jgi:CheY-like chemotaxis protein
MARILLVEDMPANQALVDKLLRLDGHEVLIAGTGARGIELAQEGCPDLVLMDIGLPDMDGWGALDALRAEAATARLRIVAFTAHAMLGDRTRALTAGFDGYLAKPVDVSTFATTVRELLS